MTKVMLGKDECLYIPGDYIVAKHLSNRDLRGPGTFEELGLVLAVVSSGSYEETPCYLILWNWRGLVRHDDGHLATFGTRLVQRDTYLGETA